MLSLLLLPLALPGLGQDTPPQVFSGPQVGEALPPCAASPVPGESTAQEDFAAASAETPLFLLFVHKRTRPALGLVQLMTGWAAAQAKNEAGAEQLVTRVVWLDDDVSGARAYLTSDRTQLDLPVPLGIAVDGGEGPGSYGLNRDVVLTLLLARGGKVLANHALGAPSDTDAPTVLADVARALSIAAPSSEDLAAFRSRSTGDAMSAMGSTDPGLRREVARLRPTRLTPEQVTEIADAIEAAVASDTKKQNDLGTIAQAAASRADFEKLGTSAARERIRAWAKKYGGKPAPSPRR